MKFRECESKVIEVAEVAKTSGLNQSTNGWRKRFHYESSGFEAFF